MLSPMVGMELTGSRGEMMREVKRRECARYYKELFETRRASMRVVKVGGRAYLRAGGVSVRAPDYPAWLANIKGGGS